MDKKDKSAVKAQEGKKLSAKQKRQEEKKRAEEQRRRLADREWEFLMFLDDEDD